MTYSFGVKRQASSVKRQAGRGHDHRERFATHADVDNQAKFCKMTVFERAGDRVLVLLSCTKRYCVVCSGPWRS
jgi:predicted proteasome-type protease